jgi:hypothetical protein
VCWLAPPGGGNHAVPPRVLARSLVRRWPAAALIAGIVLACGAAGYAATRVFGQQVTPRLVIITCGGPFGTATGRHLDNIVAWAVPA